MILAHPEVAYRDCDDCIKYIYGKDGKRSLHNWRPVLRGKSAPPCRYCPKCSDAQTPSPEYGKQATLSPQNHQVLQRYYEFRSAGGVHPDPFIRMLFSVIHCELDNFDRGHRAATTQLLGVKS